MRFSSILSLLALSAATTGCAIHPSPRDVMPFTTVEIVDHLKCEARFAMIDKVIDKLENNSLTGLEHDQLVYLGQKIHEDNDFILNENLKNLPGAKAKEFYRRYIGATIAFEFSLASYQENSNSTEVDFARVITNGTVSVPFSASNDQMRQSTRTFKSSTVSTIF